MAAEALRSDAPPFARLVKARRGTLLVPAGDEPAANSLRDYGEWAEAELALLLPLIRPGDVVVDAGAHIGIHTLAFARQVGAKGRVLAFEAQRLPYQMLCGNLALNGIANVEARWQALGELKGAVTVSVPALTSSASGADAPENDTFGLEPWNQAEASETVASLPLDQAQLRRCRLIRIGGSAAPGPLLAGARQTIRQRRPMLYVENRQRQQSAALIRLIGELDYAMYWHFAALFNPANFRGDTQDRFAGAVAPHLICLPRESGASFARLEPAQPGDDWMKARQRIAQRS